MTSCNRAQEWEQLVLRLQRELTALDREERLWIQQNLHHIQTLQRQLHQLFCMAGGPEICARCAGSCCEHGHNHMTLVNLLAAQLEGCLPQADFSCSCPFLGDSGCALPAAVRPYNCVTFICEAIEAAMDTEQRLRFYRLDQQLRELYQLFDQRYAASSLRGLLIASRRLGNVPLLSRC
ncbi:MAG: hypothetical protein JXR59_03815 [Desulfuromonadaceae bacterium]|nr:hypothetical protein [Desulfuromonadaceae bacterium]